VWKGLLILLAIAAVIALLAAGVRWLIWELQMPDDWGEDDYYYYDQDQEDEDAPITIPTVEPDADARLELAKDRGRALSAQEVYRKVSGAVVTVAVDLDGGRMSVGTGVIFREDGYILTNHHVVAGGKSCTVLLAGGRPYAAKYIASDAGYDLAVLKINAEEALPFAEFGNSDALSVGDPVYAIGTPLDIEMGGTFTDGIVSSVNREIQLTSRTSMPLIQTNAALNNGNSGGPLIDSYGQVVGINFMKLYARYSTVEGLGFAIPSVQAERVVNDLLIYGEPQPEPLLGVSVPDSLVVPAVDPLDTLVGDARKAYLKEQAAKLKAAQKAAAAKARKEKLEEIAKKRQDKTTAKLLAQKEREERRLAARKLKAESKLRARQARAARKGKVIPVDSTALREIDSLIARNDREMDSLLLQMADSLAADSLAMRIPADSVDSLTDSADSVYRLMKGFRNVRIFRSDFQAVCDSMTAISTDSTIHLYINPVLWNQGNQITSDVMDIFTENQQITRAEFIGTPMMVSQLDTVHYNQVAGKQMTAWFRDNQIYRNDVNGNAQTIYYMQDGEPPQITGMGVIESGDCSFYIEDKQVVTIVYRKDPDWNIYPMDKIPADQELYLKGFKWEGARRPTQGAVFDRRVRPSQREEKRHLAHPDFPLLKALEERKKQLIEERRWADRNDQVDAATVEWMRALGFEVGQPRESGPKL